ncbi:MAG: hypothetical protein ACJASL_002157 [Paraglaciecola sp.]|jgi:hypothetical protein
MERRVNSIILKPQEQVANDTLSLIDAAVLRTIVLDFFLTESLLCDLLFSAGKKSKQKSPLAKLCSSSNCLANLVEPSQLVLNPSK